MFIIYLPYIYHTFTIYLLYTIYMTNLYTPFMTHVTWRLMAGPEGPQTSGAAAEEAARGGTAGRWTWWAMEKCLGYNVI